MVGTRRRGQRLILAGAALLPMLGVGCSSEDSPVPAPPSPNLSAPAQAPTAGSSPQQDERQAVAAAYTQYWPRSAQAPHQPEDTWQAALGAVAVDPQLSTTLEAMRRNKSVGLTTYGDVTVRISSVEITGDSATIVDCQDASRAGQADAATGDRKTVGVPRMPVHATLARGTADGRWKVSQLVFPGGAC